jgi:3-oxoadipate enol-lactonase
MRWRPARVARERVGEWHANGKGELMDFVELNGASMRYELQGRTGPVIVMLHEMGGLLENWDEVVPALTGDHRIVRYDYRGAGLSEKLREPVEVKTLAADLLALLDHLGIQEPVTLAGCAVGAAIALCFAGRYPERSAGLVAMSPAVDMKPEDRPSRLEMLGKIEREGMRAIMDGALSAGYPQVLRDPDPERFRRFKARWLANDPESFVATYKMLIYMDITAEIAEIRCPALGVAGSLDSFRTPEYVQRIMGGIPGVEFVTIPTGHHQTAATPELIVELLRDFMVRRIVAR